MKSSHPFQLVTPLLISMSLATAANLALAAENNPGPGVTTHVDKITLNQTGNAPVMVVSANGAKYDTINSNTFAVTYSARVKCKGVWDVHYFDVALGSGGSWYDIKGKNFQNKPIGIYEDTLATWGVDSGKQSVSVTNRQLSGPLHPELGKAALNQCNAEAAKVAQQQNISLAKAMSTERLITLQSGWVNSNLRMYAWASCGKPKDTGTWLSVYENTPTVKVKCSAKPYAEGIPQQGLPNQLDSPLQTTALTLKSDTTVYSGQCPKQVTLTGEITTNKAGTIEYQWKSGNTQSILQKLTFAKGEKRQVTRTFDINQSHQTQYTLTTKGLGKNQSNAVNVKINCINTAAGNNLNLAPSSPKPAPRPAPQPLSSDLTPGATLTIGTATAPWGGVLSVDASQMNSEKRGDACKLRMVYDVKNSGQGDASAFNSILFEKTTTLHSAVLNTLKGGTSHKIAGNIFLNDGMHTIGVFVDNQKAVEESNEHNNQHRIQVDVRGCSNASAGAGATPRPR